MTCFRVPSRLGTPNDGPGVQALRRERGVLSVVEVDASLVSDAHAVLYHGVAAVAEEAVPRNGLSPVGDTSHVEIREGPALELEQTNPSAVSDAVHCYCVDGPAHR